MTSQDTNTSSRQWRARVALAAVGGLLSGIARAITAFILDQVTGH